LLRDIWNAVPYGFSVQEVVFRKAERGIGLGYVVEGPIDLFEPRWDGTLLKVPAGGGEPELVDTERRFLLTRRNATFRNPYGEALLSRLYWPWFFRVNGWRFWMQYLERFADPLLLGETVNPEDFINMMESNGFESVAALEPPGKLSAVTQSASGEFEKIDRVLTKRVQKLILGQTLTTDVEGGGSYAAAKVHDGVRETKRVADIRLCMHTVQRLIDRLWLFNEFAGKAPAFVMQDSSGLESERAERDVALHTAGVVRFTDQYLFNRYDFEAGDIERPDTPPERPEDGPSTATAAGGKGQTFAARRGRFTEDQEHIEELVEAATAQAAQPIPASVVREAINAATSPDDLAERLAVVYEDNDPAAFREVLERALFAADVLGYVAAESGMGDKT
jgi:phage gp29-like protein